MKRIGHVGDQEIEVRPFILIAFMSYIQATGLLALRFQGLKTMNKELNFSFLQILGSVPLLCLLKALGSHFEIFSAS